MEGSWWHRLKKESLASVVFPKKARYGEQYGNNRVSVKFRRQAKDELKYILKLTLYVLVDDRQVLAPQRRPRADSSAGFRWKLLQRVPGNFVIVRLAKLFQ